MGKEKCHLLSEMAFWIKTLAMSLRVVPSVQKRKRRIFRSGVWGKTLAMTYSCMA
jgi:hypothetical protein